MKGVYNLGAPATASGQPVTSAWSFPFPLASNPTAHFIYGSNTSPACTGTPANPTAAPGNLCVYEETTVNLSSQYIEDPTTNAGGAASTYGFGIHVFSNGAGYFGSRGSWAVTAP